MALTRKFLQAMGIDADKIDEIIDAHVETVNGLKDEISVLKEKSDKVPALEKQVADLEAAAKKNGENPFEKKYNDLKAQYDKLDADTKAADAKRAKETAVRALLKEQKISDKGIEKILKYQDLSGVELDENGKISKAEDLAKTLKEEWSEYIVTAGTAGAKTATPPDGKAGTTMTRDQIMAIKDTAARQQAMMENAELFGLSKE